MAIPPRNERGVGSRDVPAFDLVEATVLFRRLLGCTFMSFGSVALGKAFGDGVGLLGELAVGILVLAGSVLAAATAAPLARSLGLPSPWRYGFGALFPCPNLLVLALFGGHLLPAWASAGESPLLLLLPRRSMEARVPHVGGAPSPSTVGLIATLVFLTVSVGLMGTMVELVRGRRSPATGTSGPSTRGAPAPPVPDTSLYRPFAAQGQAAFQQADARIVGPDGATTAFGNSTEAAEVARRVGEEMEREIGGALAAYPEFRPVMAAGTRFLVYVHGRPERAVVLVQVPRFETLGDKAREAMLHLGWRAATRWVRSLRLVGARRVALGLRGTGSYSAVTWGDLTDDLPRQNVFGSPADTVPLAAFFAEARLPLPVPTPSPGSAAARLVAQRGRGSLRATAEWRAYVDQVGKPWDGEARRRNEAIRRYLTAQDAEDLLQGSEAGTMLPAETNLALSLLGGLATGYDARISSDQERRLGLALRAQCLAPPPGAGRVVCLPDVSRLWARLDRPFLEEAFRKRLDEKGPDQGLWWLLIETREGADRLAWSATLEKLVRTELRRRRGPGDALHYWLEADPVGAERLVLEELSPRQVAPGLRPWLAHALLTVAVVQDRTDAAGRGLAEIVALGGPGAAQARVAREILGLDSQDRIEALARRWRETRSGKALAEFYYAYIEKLPMGTPFEPWRERLGESNPVSGPLARSFHIEPSDQGTSLYLEVDSRGRLVAISFD